MMKYTNLTATVPTTYASFYSNVQGEYIYGSFVLYLHYLLYLCNEIHPLVCCVLIHKNKSILRARVLYINAQAVL